jgi:hypothetical protein
MTAALVLLLAPAAPPAPLDGGVRKQLFIDDRWSPTATGSTSGPTRPRSSASSATRPASLCPATSPG